MPFVTFIVPTLGRPELDRALASIEAQTDPDWAVIVEPSVGSAGETRNAAMKKAHTPWTAFLDDDDVLKPTYVEHLREHAEDYPWAEVVIFRMDHPKLGILPPRTGQIRYSTVGISFALRKEISDQYQFERERLDEPRGNEDWALISKLAEDQRQIYISPHIDYIVRDWRAHE